MPPRNPFRHVPVHSSAVSLRQRALPADLFASCFQFSPTYGCSLTCRRYVELIENRTLLFPNGGGGSRKMNSGAMASAHEAASSADAGGAWRVRPLSLEPKIYRRLHDIKDRDSDG